MKTPPLRTVLAGLLAGLAVALVATFVALPVVAGRAARRAAASRGLDLSFGALHMGWFQVTLEDAHVAFAAPATTSVDFATLRVESDPRLRPVRISGAGGRTQLEAGALARDVEAWRARRLPSSVSGGPPVAVDVRFDAVSLAHDLGTVAASGLAVRREGDRVELTVDGLEAAGGSAGMKVRDVRVVLGAPLRLEEAHVAQMDVALVAAESASTGSKAPADDAPPPPPEAPARGSRRGKERAAPLPAPPLPRLLPDLHALRGDLAAMITSVAGRVPEGSRIRIDALAGRVVKGGEELTLGSGSLDVERTKERIGVTFSTSPLAKATPLSLRALLPTGRGDVEISVSGGPVPLGLLGMRDGGLLHLLDVDRSSFAGRGRVVLDDAGDTLTFDVEGGVKGLSLKEPRLARDAIRGMDLGMRARGLMDDKGELRLDDAEATVGAARVTVHGGLTQTADRLTTSFEFDSPTTSCQSILTSVPAALVPTVGTSRMDGTFSLRGKLAFDTQKLDDVGFDFDVKDRCRLVDVPPELEKSRFARTFSHTIYTSHGDQVEETTGPGTPQWTDLEEISPYMQVAVLTTEDGAFFHHHGFNHTAIRRAVGANIKAHRFVRGASTITMQLAKNLFLTREKTLARKLEELVLADYLEQTFTKEEMLELYLNIIEFGPDLYGITGAAEHYFGRRPAELSLAECMFLAAILPNPVGYHHVYAQGQVSEGWMRTLRSHMEVAARNGLISRDELAEGLKETVTFHREGDPPPAPRPAISAASRRSGDAEWQELN